jgi:hypothetical protein
MKLGEALSLRARQAQQLESLRGRIRANSLTQEGDKPGEDPAELIDEFSTLSEDHAKLVYRIAKTNMQAQVGGAPLLKMLHDREALRRIRNIHEAAAAAATVGGGRHNPYRFSQAEIKFVPQVVVTEQRQYEQEADDAIRRLDAQIQEANWQIDLVP